MSNNDGQTYFIGNPGEGIADAFPKAERTYHAVTVLFSKSFSDLWLAQVSYTWSKLTGNYDGLFNAQGLNALGAPQLDPNINSTFDLRTLLLNQQGPLSRTSPTRSRPTWPRSSSSLLRSAPRSDCRSTPTPATNQHSQGRHPIYGAGQAFILERGSAGRLPWVTSLDARLNFNYRLTKDSVITAAVEGFNVFNSQRPLSVDENYTAATVSLISVGGRAASRPSSVDSAGSESAPPPFPAGNGAPQAPGRPGSATGAAIRIVLPNPNGVATPVVPNLAWGTPTNFQPVRQFRFSLRFTF